MLRRRWRLCLTLRLSGWTTSPPAASTCSSRPARRARTRGPTSSASAGHPGNIIQYNTNTIQYNTIQYNTIHSKIHYKYNTTSRLVTVTPGSVGYLVSSEDMKRCTVQYKVTYNTMLNLVKGDKMMLRLCRAAVRSCSSATTSTCPTMTGWSARMAPQSTLSQTPTLSGRE